MIGSELITNLIFLQDCAFSFTLDMNPHATFHQTVHEAVNDFDTPDTDDDWICPLERHLAYKTGKYIEATLYPLGSVSSYTFRGKNLSKIISAAADTLREELQRTENKHHFDSRAFSSLDLDKLNAGNSDER